LPNIKGNWNRSSSRNIVSTSDTLTGAFYKTQKGTYFTFGDSGNTYSGGDLSFDASLSSPTYQDNASVQQKAVQMYLEFYLN
jgi:hypothetical protein